MLASFDVSFIDATYVRLEQEKVSSGSYISEEEIINDFIHFFSGLLKLETVFKLFK